MTDRPPPRTPRAGFLLGSGRDVPAADAVPPFREPQPRPGALKEGERLATGLFRFSEEVATRALFGNPKNTERHFPS